MEEIQKTGRVHRIGSIAITFSETIDDLVYNLKQTMIIDEKSAPAIREIVDGIEEADEKTAREIIKRFEESVRNYG